MMGWDRGCCVVAGGVAQWPDSVGVPLASRTRKGVGGVVGPVRELGLLLVLMLLQMLESGAGGDAKGKAAFV